MLQPNTTYFIKARSVNQHGVSADSNVISVVTTNTLTNNNITNIPANPTILNISILGNSIEFNILNDVNAQYYLISISTLSDFSSYVYEQIRFNTRLNLNYNTTYYYRLYAVNILGASGFSQGQFVTTNLLRTPILRAVYNLSSIGGSIYWTPTPTADNYTLEIALNSSFTNLVSSQTTTNNQYTVGSLSEDTLYFVRVRANRISPLLVSNYSKPISFKTLTGSNTQSNITYLNLNNLTVSTLYITDITALLSWTSNDKYDNYYYELSLVNDFSTTVETGTIPINNITLTNLTENTIYYFRVRGVNKNNISQYTTINFKTFTKTSNISPPILFQFTEITSSSMKANWQKQTNVNKYILDIDTTALFNSFTRYYLDNVDNFALLNLASNTTYYVRLFSVSDLLREVSLNSNSASQTTFNSPPVLTLSDPEVFNNEVKLTWLTSPQYIKYELSIFTNLGNYLGFYKNYNLGNVNTHTVRYFLFSNKTYKYRIRAFKSNGDFREIYGTFTTLALAPELNIASNGLDINWIGEAKNIDIAYDRNFTEFFKDYPDNLIFKNYHRLPNLTKKVRIYDNNGLYSEIIDIDKLNWIRTTNKTHNSITIQWNNKYDYYLIQVLNNNGSVLPSYVYPVKTNQNFYTINNLNKNTNYKFRIYNEFDEYLPYEDTTLIHAPTDLSESSSLVVNTDDILLVDSSKNAIGLKFSNNFDYYNLDYSDNSSFVWFESLTEVKNEVVINDLQSNTLYYFRVKGIINDEICQNFYNLQISTENTISYPNIINEIPILSQAIITNGEFNFTVTLLSNNHTDFHVEISSVNNFSYIDEVLDIKKFNKNKFTLFNLGNSPKYIRVFCFNPEYRSKYSNTVSVNI